MRHDLAADVEVSPIEKINEADERMLGDDVRCCFVTDLASLKSRSLAALCEAPAVLLLRELEGRPDIVPRAKSGEGP